MKREEFIKKSLIMGIGFPLLAPFLNSCNKEVIDFPSFTTNFKGKVIIVGAGAAGLAAGYLLKRHGVDFQIIEASDDFGGRVKRAGDFVDFPIDLGAEWIHASPKVLTEILDNPQLDASIDFITYNPQTFATSEDGSLSRHNYASNFYSEHKFKSTTWYGFFEKFIVPEIKDQLILSDPITEINTTADEVVLTTNNSIYKADKVIVTAPIKVMQSDSITFTPRLTTERKNAINSIEMGHGLKAFLEFSEKFYPDMLLIGGLIETLNSDNKIYYDVAFRKDTNHHVLGLFTVQEPAGEYATLPTDQDVIDRILNELDAIYDGKASETFIKGIVQNWSKEPYIQGSYSNTFNNDQEETVKTITDPIDNKVFFAGEALSIENQATVHGACESGYAAVAKVLDS